METNPLSESALAQLHDGENYDQGQEDGMYLRYITDWFLFNEKSRKTKNTAPSGYLPPRIGFPTKPAFKPGIVLAGWLQPKDPSKNERVYVEINKLSGYVLDSNPNFRGYWISTPNAYYWLQRPDGRGPAPTQIDRFFEQRVVMDVVFGLEQKARDLGTEAFVQKDIQDILPLLESNQNAVRVEKRILKEVRHVLVRGYLRDFVCFGLGEDEFNECKLIESLTEATKGRVDKVEKADKDEWVLGIEEQLGQMPWGGPVDKWLHQSPGGVSGDKDMKQHTGTLEQSTNKHKGRVKEEASTQSTAKNQCNGETKDQRTDELEGESIDPAEQSTAEVGGHVVKEESPRSVLGTKEQSRPSNPKEQRTKEPERSDAENHQTALSGANQLPSAVENKMYWGSLSDAFTFATGATRKEITKSVFFERMAYFEFGHGKVLTARRIIRILLTSLQVNRSKEVVKGILAGLIKKQPNNRCACFVLFESFRVYMLDRLREMQENDVDVENMKCGFSSGLRDILDLIHTIVSHDYFKGKQDILRERLKQDGDVDLLMGVKQIKAFCEETPVTSNLFIASLRRTMVSLGVKPQGQLFEANTTTTTCMPAGDKLRSTVNGTLGASTATSTITNPSSQGGTIPGKLSALVSRITQSSEREDPSTKPAGFDFVDTSGLDESKKTAVGQVPTSLQSVIENCDQPALTADPETVCSFEKAGSSSISVGDALLAGLDGNDLGASKPQCDHALQQEKMSKKAVAVDPVAETDCDQKLASGSTKPTRKVRFNIDDQLLGTTKNRSRKQQRVAARRRRRPRSPTTFCPAEKSESVAIPVTSNGISSRESSPPRLTIPTARVDSKTNLQSKSRQTSEAGRGRVDDSRASSCGNRSEGPRTGRWGPITPSDYLHASKSEPTSLTREIDTLDSRGREKMRNVTEKNPASRCSTDNYSSGGGEKQPKNPSHSRKRRNSFEHGRDAEYTSDSPPLAQKRRRQQEDGYRSYPGDGDNDPYREDRSRSSSPYGSYGQHGNQPGYEAVLDRSYGRYDRTDGTENGRNQRGASSTQQASSYKPKSSYGHLASAPVQRVRSLQQASSNKPESSYGHLASAPVQRVRSLQQQEPRYY